MYPDNVRCISHIGTQSDAALLMWGFVSSGWKGNTILVDLVDLVRDAEEDRFYDSLEGFKNGAMQTEEGEEVFFNPCHLVVFANFLPKTRMMSWDRWDIRSLHNNDETLSLDGRVDESSGEIVWEPVIKTEMPAKTKDKRKSSHIGKYRF